MKRLFQTLSAIALATASMTVSAAVVSGDTCGVPDRVAALSGAEQCAFGLNNPDADTVASYYGDTWELAGETEGDEGEATYTDRYLTAYSVDWGTIPNNGTWAIDSSFWDIYDQAVITMHIGEGAGDPDHWAWLIEDNGLSGTWDLDYAYCDSCSEKGGGLSNIKLWGVSTSDVPEPSTLFLFGASLLGLGFARRYKK